MVCSSKILFFIRFAAHFEPQIHDILPFLSRKRKNVGWAAK